jgi:hypothetical protein
MSTIANNMITFNQANLRAGFLLMAIVFFSTGMVPQYLDYFGYKKMELAENPESDKGSEETEDKKESDKDDHLSQLLGDTWWHSEENTTFDGSFYRWFCSYIDIITPPPEQV